MSDEEDTPLSGRRRRPVAPDRGRINRRHTLADSSDDEEFSVDDAAGIKGSGSSDDGGADDGEVSYSSSRMKEAVVRSFLLRLGEVPRSIPIF